MSSTFWIISCSPTSTWPDFAAPLAIGKTKCQGLVRSNMEAGFAKAARPYLKTNFSSSSETNGSALPWMFINLKNAFTKPVHIRPSGYTSTDIAAIGRITARATCVACCTA